MTQLDARQVACLEGLRGLAILLVLLSHWSGFGFHWVPGLDFSGLGKAGVYLFFVLSAWLLSFRALCALEPDGWSAGFWYRYGLRRVFRILPLYTLVLAFSVVATRMNWGVEVVPLGLGDALRHAAMWEGRLVFWAIPVEFSFYACLPLVLIAWQRCPPGWRGSGLVALLVVPLLVPPGGAYEQNTTNLWAYWPAFIAGLGLAVAAYTGSGLWLWLQRRAYLLAALAGVLLVLSWPQLADRLSQALGGPPVGPFTFHAWILPYGLLWSALLGAVLVTPSLCRAFGVPLLRYLGRVSFSAYLWHFSVLRGLRAFGPESDLLSAWLGVAITLGLAGVSYYLIERPGMGMGRRLARRVHSPRSPSSREDKH